MGSDKYCAICGGPIKALHDEERRSNSERAKRHRRSIIASGRYNLYHEGSEDAVDTLRSHDDAQLRKEDNHDDNILDSEHTYTIEHSYDPDIMSGHDTSWLETVVFLVRDPDMKTVSKCYISQPGYFEDYNWAFARGHPEKPDDEIELYLYDSYDLNESVSFPCHRTCLQIFARATLGIPSVDALDPDLLYEVMSQDVGVGYSLLKLDYGDRGDSEQFWECNVGEEVGVSETQKGIQTDRLKVLCR